MGSITDSINDDVRLEMEEKQRKVREENTERERMAFKAMLTDDFASSAVKGLLADGAPVSYDTAHQAYKMAKFMVEVRSEYVC